MEVFETNVVTVGRSMSNSVVPVPGISSVTAAEDAEVAPTTRLALGALTNPETDHTTMQDTLDGMCESDGMHEDHSTNDDDTAVQDT